MTPETLAFIVAIASTVATAAITIVIRRMFGKLDVIHVLVNARLTAALQEIHDLKNEVRELKGLPALPYEEIV